MLTPRAHACADVHAVHARLRALLGRACAAGKSMGCLEERALLGRACAGGKGVRCSQSLRRLVITVHRKQEQAEKTRMDTHHGKMLVRNEEQERLRKVALSRARAVECHEAAARAKEEMLLRKQIEVQNQDRISQIAIVQAKNSLLLNNQKKRRSQFESRYVSTRAAASFEASDFRNYYMMDESADKEIAHANKSLFNHEVSHV